MDRSTIERAIGGLFDGREEVTREEALEAIDDADIDEGSRYAMKALVRDRYTREQLVDELSGLGRNAPIGGGGLGGAG